MDTREYLVELADIVGHRKNAEVIEKESPEATHEAGNGDMAPVKTTKGWEIKIEFNNGETAWLPLVDVKDSNSIELAEYAIAQ